MKYWDDAEIKSKVFLVFLLGVAIPLLASNYLGFSKYSSQIETMVVDMGFESALNHTQSIKATLDGYKRTLIPLGGSAPIKGYNVALNQGGRDQVPGFGLSTAEWKRSIDDMFVEIVKSDESYTQLRYIDSQGNEISKVVSREGVPEIIPEDKLQNKSDSYYFQEGLKLSPGKVYVSYMDLNRAGTPPQIAVPHLPNVRFVTPVVSITTSGQFFGLVVANVHADKIFETMQHQNVLFDSHVSERFVVDNNGYYLKHQDPSKTFGGPRDLDTGENVKNDYPRIDHKILSGEPAAFAHDSSLVAYAPVYPYMDNADEFWTVIEIAPKDAALSSLGELKQALFTITVLFIGVLAVCFFILAHIATLATKDIKEEIEELIEAK